MENRTVKRGISTRSNSEMQIRGTGDGCKTRIDDDQLRSVITGLPDPMNEGGKRLTDVRAADHDDFRVREVAEIVRRPIEAKRLLVSRAGAHHAKATVIVEVARFEGDACELADEIAHFVRKRDARKHCE